jgi:PAS domain S-box-containing protein
MSMPVQSEALRELSRAGEAYRFLLSERDLAVLVLSETIEDCNEAACRLFGVTRDEFIGRSPLEFAPPCQPDGSPSDVSARTRLASALAGLAQWCTWQYRRKDGKLVDTLVHVEAVRVDGVRRVLIRIRDVSQLERAEIALKETETRLQQILDNTSTAVVFAKDLSGRYLFVNRAFERILGIPQEEIVGRTTAELFQPDVAEELRANDLRVILSRRKIEVEEKVTVRGETRWLLSNKFPLFGRDGEPYAVCGIAADITDRKRTEDALRRAALAVSGATGKQALQSLVGALCEILEVDVALVSVFTDPEHTRMRTLAAMLDGKQLRSYDYVLAESPCAGLIGHDFRFVESGARHEMRPGSMFYARSMDSYAAYALADSAGVPIGLIAVMNRAPMRDGARVEAMLKIFAVRAAAEIERNRAEEALRSAAVAVSSAAGDAVFPELTRALATMLDVEVAFIALPVPGDPSRLRMLAFYLDGRIVDEFEYPIAGTPCETVFGRGYRAYPEGVTELFPLDDEFRKIGVQSYAGFPLNDVRGAPIGIISVVSRKPLGNPELAESMLKIFAARAVTEIEHKLAEERLRASEEQYRAIFNATADGLALFDADARIVDANPAFCTLFGYQRDELRTISPKQLVAPESVDMCNQVLASASGGAGFQGECRAMRRDGAVFEIELRGMPMHYVGQPHRLVVVRDITGRKRADERLRQSEGRYRLLFEMESDAILLVDVETLELRDANRAAVELYGCSRDELLRMKATDISVEQVETAAAIRGHTGTMRIPLRHHRRRDGTIFPVEISSNLLELGGRRILLAAIRDITERKAGEARLRATVEAALESIIIMNERGDITEFNPAAERCFGLRRADVLGKRLADVLIPERFRDAHRRGLARYLETGSSPLVGKRIEVVAQRADGSEFPAELAIAMARESHGRIFVGYLRDITERRRAEAERGRLEAQLRQAQKMEAIGHLTGGIAHDFNNILTSILGYIVLGEERQADGGDAKLGRYLEQAKLAAQRARDLIQQMLTFSRGQRGERRALALPPLVRDSVKLLRSTLPATIELETDVEEAVPPVMMDPVQIEQVLLNLCINARDAMGGVGQITVGTRLVESGETSCASCRQQVTGRFVELWVRDTGPGIEPDVIERMFEPFFTTKDVGRGSGMGLSMVHGIVHDHGGHIAVDTAPGRGTVFRLRFGAAGAASAAADVAVRNGRGAAERRPQLAGRVLLVDDEQMVGDFMAELLSNWGLDVVVKRNPVEAEGWIMRDPGRVDLVLTDQTMPKLTGLDLAARITSEHPRLPVVLYTGYGDNISEEDLARCGVRALIRKPVEPETLLAVLRANLPGSRVGDEPAEKTRVARPPSARDAPAKSAQRSRKTAPRKQTAHRR